MTRLIRMKLVHPVLIAVLALTGLLPSAASAQVFLASKPHPDFAVGPLFVIANVRPDLSVTVNLSFSLTLRKGAARSAMEQDLYLLWPAEVAEPTAPGPADPAFGRAIHEGLAVLSSGRLVLRSRDRTLVGTGQLGEALPEIASYVTVTRRTSGQPGQPRHLHQDSVDPKARGSTHRDDARHADAWTCDAEARAGSPKRFGDDDGS